MERNCDICALSAIDTPAIVDAKTIKGGRWAYLCESHDKELSASQHPMLRLVLADLPSL
jgi:hypothetical protein